MAHTVDVEITIPGPIELQKVADAANEGIQVAIQALEQLSPDQNSESIRALLFAAFTRALQFDGRALNVTTQAVIRALQK